MKWTSKHYAKWNRYKMLYLEFDFTYMIYSEKASLWTETTLVVALSEKQGGKEGGSEDWPQEGLMKIWGAWWKWTKSGLWWCWLVCDSQFSCVQLLATPWTVGHQAPLSMEILQARTLEWVAMPSSRGSSRPRDRIHISHVSCVGRQVLYHSYHLGSPDWYNSIFTKPQIVNIVGQFFYRMNYNSINLAPKKAHWFSTALKYIMKKWSEEEEPRGLC